MDAVLPVPTLLTARLLLRPVRAADAAALWPFMADPDTSRWMSWEPHAEIAQTQALLERLLADMARGAGCHWTLAADGRICGLFSLIAIHRHHRALTYHRAELAYWLGREWRGRGLMTEAGRAVIAHAFGPLNIHRLVVGHFAVNDGSRRLIERLGFNRIGVERHAFMKDGTWHDMVSYDLLASDRVTSS